MFTVTAGVLVALAAFHLTQGTSAVDTGDLLRLVVGSADPGVWNVLSGSRLPRLAAAVLVGIALGASGCLLQSIARNPLASPDTLAVNAGAYLAITVVAAFGITLPMLSGIGVAFVGALATAGLVLALASGGGTATTRLILAGSATMMAANAMVSLLLLLFEQETMGLFAWGSGNLTLTGFTPLLQTAPLVLLAVAASVALASRLDVMRLGDDTAASLGVHVRRTRLLTVVVALLLAACAVAVAGPIGFVGLAAPVAARLVAERVPDLMPHRFLVPFSALCGAIVIIGADVALRAIVGAERGVTIPVGVATTLVGAAVMVWLARRVVTGSGSEGRPTMLHGAANRGRLAFGLIVGGLSAAVAAAVITGMLAGDQLLLGGDIWNWVQGRTGSAYTWIIDQRYPRVLAAVLAGAALACAGTVTQGVCRNPLAEPSILGVTAGAGVGAVACITLAPGAGAWTITVFAAIGGLAAFALVYSLAWRGGLDTTRLVLIGIGVAAAGMAVVTLIILYSDPWNTPKAMTWLSGTTYGRTADRLVPLAAALVGLVPLLVSRRREIDLLSLDDDTPRVLGVRLERTRLAVLAGAAVLTAAAVAVVGVIVFVGLVAPHLARALVGSRTTRAMPVAILLGTLLVSIADTLGRTVIAPAQIPAGLVCALIGTPYFIWLLWRGRTRIA